MNVKANIKTLTSDELEKHPTRARQAAESGPLFIITDGVVSHVLMTKADFDRLEKRAEDQKSAREALMHPQGDDFDFEPPRMRDGTFKPATFD